MARSQAATLSVEVSVKKLTALAKKRREGIVKNHAKTVAAYNREVAGARRKLVVELRARAGRIVNGREQRDDVEYPRWRSGSLESTVRVNMKNVQPDEEPNTAEIDRIIAMLEAASNETIKVRDDSPLAKLLVGNG